MSTSATSGEELVRIAVAFARAGGDHEQLRMVVAAELGRFAGGACTLADDDTVTLAGTRVLDGAERRILAQLVDLAVVSLATARHQSALVRELDAFEATLAEELRAPLRAIVGYSESLLGENADQLDGTSLLDLLRIRSHANVLNERVADLYRLTRIASKALIREPVSITGVARAIAQLHQAQAPARRVTFEIAETSMRTTSSPAR